MLLHIGNKSFALCLAAVMLLQTHFTLGSERSPLEAFPAATDGMQRFVIELAHKERSEEHDFRVEIVVGKQMPTDGVNLYRLGYSIERRVLQGWGYNYYEVVGKGETMSTLMAPPEGAPMVERFVTAEPLLVPYNSRLPIVVYAPSGCQIRYRVWHADEVFNEANRR
jgi:ecotin